MKKILFPLLVIAFIITACDVLDHDPYDNAGIELFFGDLSVALTEIHKDDVSAVMALYSDDYSNNQLSKADIADKYNGVFYTLSDSLTFSAKLVEYNKYFDVTWDLTIGWEEEAVQRDTTYTFHDVLRKESTGFMLYGNQVNPPALDPTKPVVFVEFGTSQSCGNCPAASAELSDLQMQYGEQLIFVEYCYNQPATPEHFYVDWASYYGAYAQPSAMFQGNYLVQGGAPDQLVEYNQRYNQIVEGTPQAFVTSLDATTEPGLVIVGTTLDIGPGIPASNLYLRAAVVDEHPEVYYSSGHEPIHNLVFGLSEMAITGSDYYEMEIEYDYYDQLPQHSKVVVWVQTRTDIYDNETCTVHTAAELAL